MNVLITGGGGYVGAVLTRRLLERGHAVRVLDALLYGGASLLGIYSAVGSARFEFQRGDVRSADAVASALDGMDAVVHLASVVGERACDAFPELARSTNLDGTKNLVAQARRSGVGRLFFASTCSNYGVTSETVPATESDPVAPGSLYSRTKTDSERTVLEASGNGFAACVLRLATVFGVSARMRFDLLLHEFIRDAAVNGRISLYGPRAWRPLVHIEDVATAMDACLDAPASDVAGRTFNVGGDAGNCRKQELAETVQRHFPGTEVVVQEDQTDRRDYRVSFEKIASVLGVRPSIGIDEGVRQVRDVLRSGLVADPCAPGLDNLHPVVPDADGVGSGITRERNS